MKTLIILVIVALLGFGLWWSNRGDDTIENQGAQVSGSLDGLYNSDGSGSDSSSSGGADDNSGYDDKG